MSRIDWPSAIKGKHQDIQRQNLWRQRRLIGSVQKPELIADGQRLINFSSNDYLGLAAHPAITEAIAQKTQHWGAGSGASHLVCGHSSEHHDLEARLADFVGAERALLFSSGYMANIAVNAVFPTKGDLCLHDKLNHASLIDGARLSEATFKRYAHANTNHAERLLASNSHQRLMLVSDGVFSMDGDIAPIKALMELNNKHSGLLYIDDAHGIGVLGKGGAGTLSHFGASPTGNVLMLGTLGKAFGSFGAFVAGDSLYIEHLIQSARSYIFTTALPPSVVAASAHALSLIQQEHDQLSSHLSALIALFKQQCSASGIELLPSQTPIQPINVGSESAALALANTVQKLGFLVPAIRTPTVPKGQARLRVTLTAAHTQAQVKALVVALAEAFSALAAEFGDLQTGVS